MLLPLVDLASPELDRKIDLATRKPERRVTIIALDGTVLADSDFSGNRLASMDNHLQRPEVQQALAEGVGFRLVRCFDPAVNQPEATHPDDVLHRHREEQFL